jgi:class 3 adenylate cyclase
VSALAVLVAIAVAAVDAPAVVGALDPPASIAGPWRCIAGDDARYKDVDVDDSGWAVTTLPEAKRGPCEGRVVWLRRRIQFERVPDVAVGVAVGRVDGAYEVYVDGVLVGGHGNVDTLEDPEHSGEAFAVPAAVVADGVVVVAVRVGLEPALNQIDIGRRLVPEGPLVMGQMPSVNTHAQLMVRDELREGFFGFAVMIPLFVFISLYHVLLWLLRRERLGYLWFGIASFLTVTWLATVELRNTSMLPLSAVEAGIIGNFFGSLVNAAYVEFFWRFIDQKKPSKPWRIYQVILVGISLLGFIPKVGLSLTVFPLVVLAKVLLPVFAIVMVVRRALKGSRDARALLVGVVVAALGAPAEVLVEHGGVPLQVSPGMLAFAFFSLFMAVALSAQFARTLDDLDKRNQEMRSINASISRFVPFGFLQALDRVSVVDVERGDAKKREMAVMFCDVRGFTTLAEGLGPDATFRFINEYLSRMEPEIYKGAGFINQYLGDGIMALFPSTDGADARSGADGAVAAAIGMAHALAHLNSEREKRGEAPVKTGTGIHLGALMIGTIGGGEQLDGGVIGDVANAASRIEGMTKMYDARVLMSGTVVAGLSRTRPVLRHLDTVRAKGKTEPLAVYEVLDTAEDSALKKDTLQAFTDAQRAYKAGDFDAAIVGFDAVLARNPHDGAARLLRDRCHELKAGEFEGVWSGVYTLTAKS